eukprot:scaffold447855_cov18-Prasinocladus_malaysianus.AAC.1
MAILCCNEASEMMSISGSKLPNSTNIMLMPSNELGSVVQSTPILSSKNDNSKGSNSKSSALSENECKKFVMD